MPEGPEVKCIVDGIQPIVGLNIWSVNVNPSNNYKWARDGISGQHLLKTPIVVDRIYAKGKLIRMDLSDPANSLGSVCVLSTLGLEGSWQIADSAMQFKHKRVWFGLDDDLQLVYTDSRNFGTIKITKPRWANKKLETIGWDLLQAPMDTQDWAELQTDPKIEAAPIGSILMQQKQFSGIGNIYKAEILYQLKIHPETRVGSMGKEMWATVNHTAHQVLQAAYQARGSSVKSYSGGSFQRTLSVYRKELCPLDHPVSKVEQAKRTTWFCNTCQPLI